MENKITFVVEELGRETALGRPVHTGEDMNAVIREGFPRAVVQALVKASGLSLRKWQRASNLSIRSLQRRKYEGRLARYESDRLYRLAGVVALAKHFIGNHKTVVDWLRRPNLVLVAFHR
jgi:putative toxin-antitoxin system antitoxin component (TIGR02293 family)